MISVSTVLFFPQMPPLETNALDCLWVTAQTDRQKVTYKSPQCKLHRWAKKDNHICRKGSNVYFDKAMTPGKIVHFHFCKHWHEQSHHFVSLSYHFFQRLYKQHDRERSVSFLNLNLGQVLGPFPKRLCECISCQNLPQEPSNQASRFITDRQRHLFLA